MAMTRLFTVLAAVALPLMGRAQTEAIWIGPSEVSEGSYSESANWNPNGMPTKSWIFTDAGLGKADSPGASLTCVS